MTRLANLLALLFTSACVAQVIHGPVAPAASAVAAGYAATAATFAGDGQCWLELDGADSVASTDFGMLSFWWNPAGANGDVMRIFGTDNRVRIQRSGGDNSIRAILIDSTGATVVSLQQNVGTVGALTSTSGWCWIGIAWDNTTAGRCYIYIANAATSWVATDCTTRNNDTGGGEDIDNDDFEWVVGAENGGSSPLAGCLSEIYYDTSSWRDLTSSAVRDLFYNSTTHKPAGDLTAVGSPEFYLKGDGTGFTVNSGSAGNLTKKGTTALTSCTGP